MPQRDKAPAGGSVLSSPRARGIDNPRSREAWELTYQRSVDQLLGCPESPLGFVDQRSLDPSHFE